MKPTLVMVAALSLFAVGCGGVENEPNLAAAIDRTEAQGSGMFTVEGTQRMSKKPVEYGCTGEADYAAKSVHVDCDYAGDRDRAGVLHPR